MTANDLTAFCVDYLNLKGHYVWRQNNVRVAGRKFRGMKGVSDVVGFTKNGRALYVESTIPPDRQSNEQKEFQAECNKRGAIYLVIENEKQLQVSGL